MAYGVCFLPLAFGQRWVLVMPQLTDGISREFQPSMKAESPHIISCANNTLSASQCGHRLDDLSANQVTADSLDRRRSSANESGAIAALYKKPCPAVQPC